MELLPAPRQFRTKDLWNGIIEPNHQATGEPASENQLLFLLILIQWTRHINDWFYHDRGYGIYVHSHFLIAGF